MRTSRPCLTHLFGSVSLACALIGTAVALPDTGASRAGALRASYEAGTDQALLEDGHDHTHDPATKNALSRGGDVSAATADPTTARQARDAAAYVATQRRLQGTPLRMAGSDAFRVRAARGCPAFGESQVNVSGRPHAGVSPYQEVRGYVDAHTHGMAFEFLGGAVHCGKPWDKYGPAHALVDCPDHSSTNGYGAALETALGGKPGHDPVGWPTFKDWPAPESLTHEGTSYKWLERSWRGGQRIFVNVLVENNKLCELYPLKKNSCDDMDSVRLQAQRMYELRDYIDAQAGGPGLGWYRIVRSPWPLLPRERRPSLSFSSWTDISAMRM